MGSVLAQEDVVGDAQAVHHKTIGGDAGDAGASEGVELVAVGVDRVARA